MQHYFRFRWLTVFGIPVYVHWAVLAVIGALLLLSVQSPVLAILSMASYFGLILLHECGHAYFAMRLGYRAVGIYLGVFHGLYRYEAPESQKDRSIVACGGVAAQLAVAIPLLVLSATTSIEDIPGISSIVMLLGDYSLLLCIVNLVPVPPLDGAEAWKLVPILLNRHRRKGHSRNGKFKIVK